MIVCPICGRSLTDTVICKCGTHVGVLRQIADRANALFNQALDAAHQGDFVCALRLLDTRETLVPPDVEVSLMQIQILVQLDRWKEAEAALRLLETQHPLAAEMSAVIAARAERKE